MPLESGQKLLLCVLDEKIYRPQFVKTFAHEFRFALAHQPRVHINAAYPLGTQSSETKRVRYRRVHTATAEEEDVSILHNAANLLFDQRHALGDVPIDRRPANTEDEVGKYLRARMSVRHLGMKLNAEDFSPLIGHRRYPRRLCGSGHFETGRRRRDRVPMIHPDLRSLQCRSTGDPYARRSGARFRTRRRRPSELSLPGDAPRVDGRSRFRAPEAQLSEFVDRCPDCLARRRLPGPRK